MQYIRGGTDRERVIVFVDGSNFLIELSKLLGIKFNPYNPPVKSIDFASELIKSATNEKSASKKMIRKYWFGSFRGNDNKKIKYPLLEALKKNQFEPKLFHLPSNQAQEKGVDIALTLEMILMAANKTYDEGWIIAGDADYVGLVKEVKRYGQIINGSFFENNKESRNSKLKWAVDSFKPISFSEKNEFLDILNKYKPAIKKEIDMEPEKGKKPNKYDKSELQKILDILNENNDNPKAVLEKAKEKVKSLIG